MVRVDNPAAIIEAGLAAQQLGKKRVLLIIPDTTRTAPVGQLVQVIHGVLKKVGAHVDVLVALGTHQPLSAEAMLKHLELTRERYEADYGDMQLLNHTWDDPASLMRIGTLRAEFIEEVSGGLLKEDVAITINRVIEDYDHLLILGPVFPHEVAGFSGGSKYLFPGVSGPEIINFFHWLGALITSLKTIGRADNPVRRVLDEAAKLVPVPVSAISVVVHEKKLAGVFVGAVESSWHEAVALSSQLHIVRKPKPFQKVLACIPEMYDDFWTGGKGMYKCEAVVADGGEIILYAPHITSLSYTHGHWLERIGYHVRDYYLRDMARFADVPRAVMAISTYVRGDGVMEDGIEKPRIRVTLASGVGEDVCRKVGLGYVDPGGIDMAAFENREEEGVLVVEKAGETLFLLDKGEEA